MSGRMLNTLTNRKYFIGITGFFSHVTERNCLCVSDKTILQILVQDSKGDIFLFSWFPVFTSCSDPGCKTSSKTLWEHMWVSDK